jgi:mRNA interferase YafQ
MNLEIVASNQFKKDLKRAQKRGLKMNRLKTVVDTLAAGETLDEKYRDHSLIGNYRGFRECHVESDWLLLYRIDSDVLELFLFRTGTHSDLF